MLSGAHHAAGAVARARGDLEGAEAHLTRGRRGAPDGGACRDRVRSGPGGCLLRAPIPGRARAPARRPRRRVARGPSRTGAGRRGQPRSSAARLARGASRGRSRRAGPSPLGRRRSGRRTRTRPRVPRRRTRARGSGRPHRPRGNGRVRGRACPRHL
jgi:hypothetical protein